jgi:uncharacterized repeat protein (TIGR03837 family)
MRWDLFGRVIDNFGDVGVCWRLAADLAARGESVRLWLDDRSALRWLAPDGATGVAVYGWDEAAAAAPGDVVVEAFGCDPPPDFVARMARRSVAPLWINLEYLSAEAYVRRSHGLPSPQLGGPGQGLSKWFFYPGFTQGSGGLIREPGLMAERIAFDARAWLLARGLAPRPGERVASLFCYDTAPVPSLLQSLAHEPTLLLVTPGAALQAMHHGRSGPATLRCLELPWLRQTDYDRLLWACDLNFVRGEDSFVRAQWAGAPFVWQIYPQHDMAHAGKLDAFLQLFLAGAASPLCAELRALWRAWNALEPWPGRLPRRDPWQIQCVRWRERLLEQPDLVTRLLGFVREKR